MGFGGDTISTAQLVLVAFEEVGFEPASGGEAEGVGLRASQRNREREREVKPIKRTSSPQRKSRTLLTASFSVWHGGLKSTNALSRRRDMAKTAIF